MRIRHVVRVADIRTKLHFEGMPQQMDLGDKWIEFVDDRNQPSVLMSIAVHASKAKHFTVGQSLSITIDSSMSEPLFEFVE